MSAAPAEIVEPLARHFGAHEAVASIAEVGVDGRYTGQLERYAYGAEKARLVQQLAVRDGLDLDASYAYSDSVSDVPMLEVVGHPVAVNPDRALRRVAGARGWEVRHFDRMLAVASPWPRTPPHRAGPGRADLAGFGVLGPARLSGCGGRGCSRRRRGGGMALPVAAG